MTTTGGQRIGGRKLDAPPAARDDETFGQRLRRLRLTKRLSQEALATLAGCSGAVISQWENSRHAPTYLLIASVARTLNVSLDYLVNGRECNPLWLQPRVAMRVPFVIGAAHGARA